MQESENYRDLIYSNPDGNSSCFRLCVVAALFAVSSCAFSVTVHYHYLIFCFHPVFQWCMWCNICTFIKNMFQSSLARKISKCALFQHSLVEMPFRSVHCLSLHRMSTLHDRAMNLSKIGHFRYRMDYLAPAIAQVTRNNKEEQLNLITLKNYQHNIELKRQYWLISVTWH
jgi:hypothetical protein